MVRRFVFVIEGERMMGLKTFVTLFHPRERRAGTTRR
jgi:hypothetical protein